LGESSMGWRKLTEAPAHFGGVISDSTVARTRQATGEALLARRGKTAEKVLRITGDPRKSKESERAAEGFGVARKRSNVRGAKGPC